MAVVVVLEWLGHGQEAKEVLGSVACRSVVSVCTFATIDIRLTCDLVLRYRPRD